MRQKKSSTSTLTRNIVGASSTGNISSISSCNSSSCSLVLKGNAAMQVIQRSNGKTVKSVIAELKGICEEHPDSDSSSSSSHSQSSPQHPPLQAMALLAQWASVDVYYKVVITKDQGIPTIVSVMTKFQNSADIQMYGCLALGHLSDKQQIQKFGGVEAILAAMRAHPDSIGVQSEALYALKQQGALLAKSPRNLLSELHPLLSRSKEIYLTRSGEEGKKFVLKVLEAYQIPC